MITYARSVKKSQDAAKPPTPTMLHRVLSTHKEESVSVVVGKAVSASSSIQEFPVSLKMTKNWPKMTGNLDKLAQTKRMVKMWRTRMFELEMGELRYTDRKGVTQAMNIGALCPIAHGNTAWPLFIEKKGSELKLGTASLQWTLRTSSTQTADEWEQAILQTLRVIRQLSVQMHMSQMATVNKAIGKFKRMKQKNIEMKILSEKERAEEEARGKMELANANEMDKAGLTHTPMPVCELPPQVESLVEDTTNMNVRPLQWEDEPVMIQRTKGRLKGLFNGFVTDILDDGESWYFRPFARQWPLTRK